jgi:hypothetical protein
MICARANGIRCLLLMMAAPFPRKRHRVLRWPSATSPALRRSAHPNGLRARVFPGRCADLRQPGHAAPLFGVLDVAKLDRLERYTCHFTPDNGCSAGLLVGTNEVNKMGIFNPIFRRRVWRKGVCVPDCGVKACGPREVARCYTINGQVANAREQTMSRSTMQARTACASTPD